MRRCPGQSLDFFVGKLRRIGNLRKYELSSHYS